MTSGWRFSSTAPTSTPPRRRSASTSTTASCSDEFAPRPLLRAFYYTALVEDQEYSPIRPLVDWLDYNGYTLVTKPAKEFTDSTGRRKVKGDMDVEIAVDVLEMAPHVDHIVLFSGDGDFRRWSRRCSARACACSSSRPSAPSRRWSPTTCAAQADNFIELADLRERDRPAAARASGARPLQRHADDEDDQ